MGGESEGMTEGGRQELGEKYPNNSSERNRQAARRSLDVNHLQVFI